MKALGGFLIFRTGKQDNGPGAKAGTEASAGGQYGFSAG
jgi:hypothetical protein